MALLDTLEERYGDDFEVSLSLLAVEVISEGRSYVHTRSSEPRKWVQDAFMDELKDCLWEREAETAADDDD